MKCLYVNEIKYFGRVIYSCPYQGCERNISIETCEFEAKICKDPIIVQETNIEEKVNPQQPLQD